MLPFFNEPTTALSIAADAIAILSILINIFLFVGFLLKSYVPSSFFSGHWSGVLSDQDSSDLCGSLEFFAIFYVSSGQLVGQLYYHGPYENGRYVRGFDRLPNDTRRFKKVTGTQTRNPFVLLWRRLVGTSFEAAMDRALHTIHNQQTGEYEVEAGGPRYKYTFQIRSRFRHPRLSCSVSGRADEHGCARNFVGELVKQGGIPRFGAG